jgi:hypothetical protein
MAKLAREGKIIQGMFVGRKNDVHREMWVVTLWWVVVQGFVQAQAWHFPQSSLHPSL